jgi:hypothetical protein
VIHSSSGDLPKHIYCSVNSDFVRKNKSGLEPCVWFGLHSHPGRAWGCHIMLECGAVYRNIPPHALAFSNNPEPWALKNAQVWNCYGHDFSTVEYTFLRGLQIHTKHHGAGHYLFTAIPINDGYTEDPAQEKEFMFCALDNGRLIILPTNMLLFEDKSFTDNPPTWPSDLQTAETKWSCE